MGGDLSGAKIAFTYLDYPFGQEPINILKTLAEREGFDLALFPVPLPGNDQASTWTQMRRYQPDYIISWLLAGGHVVAAREMRRNGIPLEKYISVNWFNEVDIANLGAEEAKGIKRGTSVVGGQDVPIIQEILATLYANGEGSGPREKVNDVYYNTGLAIYSVAFEAARIALETTGEFTPASMKAALESLENFDANGLMAPVTVTPEDHGGGGKTRIEMWNGTTWEPQSDWISAYSDVVWEVVKKYSAEFEAENK
jgi:branched-chain amino acid transport system substrate-binding protein